MFDFEKPRRPVTKVYIHCSASDHAHHDNVATMDAWHKQRGWSGVGYHMFERKDGTWEFGRSLEKTPAAQGGHNRGTIAICLHGLSLSKFTAAQKQGLINLCCQINEEYGGRVTFHGHNEVAAKACPVIDYKSILKLDSKGRLGVKPKGLPVLHGHESIADLEAPETNSYPDRATLRMGSKGPLVHWLQTELKEFGYHSGAIDGHFGRMTRDAVLAFQADNHLIEDGIVGNGTYEAMEDAEKRQMSKERKAKTVVGLAADGSRIAKGSLAQGLAGTGFSIGGTLALVEQTTGTVSRAAESLSPLGINAQSLAPWICGLVLLGGLYVVIQAIGIGRARAEDHQSGKTR